MQPIRVKTVQESDLRMLGNLARNIQRVLPVTQADIDAAAALGEGWVVWKVFEVAEPLDNMRGGTQLIIRQNSVQPGQNVRRVIFVSGPGGQTVIVRGSEYIALPDAIANSLEYLKAFGGTEQRNIPAEYTQVEYLKSDGNQYIDTGIVLKSEATITMVVQANSWSGAGPFAFWGFLGSPNNLPRWGWSIYSNRWLPDINTTSNASTADTNKHTFVNTCYYNNDVLVYDSLLDGNSISGGTVVNPTTYTSNTLSAYLFARNNNGTAGNFLSCRIFSYEIAQDGVKVLSLVPCRRNGDSVLGMYDTVSGTFFTNAGTGTFTAGADVTTPTPDTPVNIVSNNGALKVSRNLFDEADATILNLQSYGGSASTLFVNLQRYGWAIPVKGSTTYTISKTDNLYLNVCLCPQYPENGLAVTYIAAGATTQYTVTTGADTTYLYLYTAAPTVFNNLQVEPGSTATPYRPYGIYTDGTVETINVHGKNLFDAQNAEIAESTAISANGSLVANQGVNTCESYIKVSPNTTYTISGDKLGAPNAPGSSAYYFRLATYDANKQFLARSIDSETVTNKYTFTTGANAEYIRFHYAKAGNISTFQLEQGSIATEYEPYYDGGTATAEMLLKVGNYQDVQSIIDGVVTRNIGVKVFDGTENWFAYGGGAGYQTTVQDMLSSTSGAYFCTHATAVSSITSRGIRFGAGNKTLYWCQINTIFTTLDIFKAWLASQYNAGTPVIIVYPLATPTTESVTGQPMQVQQGDNIVEITQASLDNLELEAKYQAAVTLTIQEVQDANLDPNVEVTIN